MTNYNTGALQILRGLAQQLTALAAPAEDQGSVPSTHMVTQNCL